MSAYEKNNIKYSKQMWLTSQLAEIRRQLPKVPLEMKLVPPVEKWFGERFITLTPGLLKKIKLGTPVIGVSGTDWWQSRTKKERMSALRVLIFTEERGGRLFFNEMSLDQQWAIPALEAYKATYKKTTFWVTGSGSDEIAVFI